MRIRATWSTRLIGIVTREKLRPGAAEGLIGTGLLAGCRNDAAFLRDSRHVPPRWEQCVKRCLHCSTCLKTKQNHQCAPSWGTGSSATFVHLRTTTRLARFLMNAMQASGGYPWAVIHLEHRDAYIAALERVTVFQDIEPFARLVAGQMKWSMERQVQPGSPQFVRYASTKPRFRTRAVSCRQ